MTSGLGGPREGSAAVLAAASALSRRLNGAWDAARRAVPESRVARHAAGAAGSLERPAGGVAGRIRAASRDPILVAVALALLAGFALRATPMGPLLGVAVVGTIGVRLAFRWGRGDAALALLLVGALLVRLLLVAGDANFDLFRTPDALKYHVRAASLAAAVEAGEPWQAMDNLKTAAFEAVLAPLHLWFGPSMFVGRALNCVLAMAAVFNVVRIGRVLFDRRAGLAGGALFAFLPSAVATHAELLREALIVLLVTEAVFLLLATRLGTLRSVALLSASLAPLALLRLPLLLVLIVPVVLVAGAAASRAAREVLRGSGVAAARPALGPLMLLAGLAGAATFASVAMASAGPLYTGWLDLDRLMWVRSSWALGDSAYGAGVEFHSWWDVAAYAPVGAAAFVLSPFPWQVHNAVGALALAENLAIMYPVIALAGLVLVRRRGEPGVQVLAAMLAAGVLLFGLIEGNVGTALRHRLVLSWGFFVLAGPALVVLWEAVLRAAPQPAAQPAPVADGGGTG